MIAPPVLPPDLHPRTTFWAAAAPLMVTTNSAELARRQVDGVVDLLALEPGAAVMDLQCATNGQVAIELARRDLDVTAIAFNPALGDLVRQRAAVAGVSVRVRVGRPDEEHDWADDVGEVAAVLDLGSPFGVVDGVPDPLPPLSRAVECLAPGGAIAVLTMGTEVALAGYVGRDWYELGDRLVLLEAEPEDDWTRLRHRWRIYDGDAHSDLQFDHRLLSARQLLALLQAAGVTTPTLHAGDVDGSIHDRPYDRHAGRLVAVGRR